MSLQFEEHRNYVSDEVRTDAFARALANVIRPGDVVVDLGCGTGILGLLALEAGASRVYAIDDTAMLAWAREIAIANGFADRIVHVRGMSTHVTLPEAANVVVADQVGRLGVDAGLPEYFADAARRFLEPHGRLVPRSVTTMIAPVEAAGWRRDHEHWEQTRTGLTWGPLAHAAMNVPYATRLSSDDLLASGQALFGVTFGRNAVDTLEGSTTFAIERDGVLDGLGGWFNADLTDDVTMTTRPGAADAIARGHGFLPLARTAVQRGDRIDVSLRTRPIDDLFLWSATVWRGSRVISQSRHSTLHALPMQRCDLRAAAPSAVPRLTELGALCRDVLVRCDGRESVADLECAVASSGSPIVGSSGAAARLVADLLAKYARRDDR